MPAPPTSDAVKNRPALFIRGLNPRLVPRLFRSLAEESRDFDGAPDIGLTGQADGLALPAPADEGEGLGEPDSERELLRLRRRRQILRARDRDDGAGCALADPAAPVPEARVGVQRRVPEPVSLPDVDLL